MKRKIILLLILPVLAVLTAVLLSGLYYANADNASDFTVNDSILLKYNGTDSNVIIPSGITEIGREAFANNPIIETISFPDSVVKIDYGAFSNCNGLQSIIIPNEVTEIEDSAFLGCSQLNKVFLGKNLERLGNGVFSACNSLESIDIDPANQLFCCFENALYNKDKTTLYQYLSGSPNAHYDMPDTVNEIKRYAFWGCRNLEDVMVSAGMTKIPEYSFSNCEGLETVKIDPPVNQIELKAFENCTQLQQVTFPISVGNIHENAFDGCNTSLLFVCEKDSTPEIFAQGHGYETSNVERYQVEYIEEIPVPNPTNNEDSTNTNPNTTDSNDLNDNQNGQNLTNEMESQNSNVSNVDNGTVLGNGTIVSDRVFIAVDQMNVHDGADLKTNDSTETVILSQISDYAFYCDNDLLQYTFEDTQNIEAIGRFSFARSGLREIVIPEGVEVISYGAFYHCDSLEEIEIPSSVTQVEAYAFEHTPWLDAWREDNSEDLNDDFLIVGDGVLIAYKGSREEVIIPNTVKTIADNVFRDHNEIVSITIPESVQYIGSYTFFGCSNLVEVNCDFNRITMESNAFEHQF